MKPFNATAHINSLHGGIGEITVLEEKQLSPEQAGYIVDYNGVICTAIFNWFTCSYYADDIYGKISENSEDYRRAKNIIKEFDNGND